MIYKPYICQVMPTERETIKELKAKLSESQKQLEKSRKRGEAAQARLEQAEKKIAELSDELDDLKKKELMESILRSMISSENPLKLKR